MFECPVGVLFRQSPVIIAQQTRVMNGVRVFPKKRRPPSGKCPESREPPIKKRGREYPQVRVIVKIYADIYPRDPPKRARRSQHKRRARPRAVNAHQRRMFVQPKRTRVRHQASNMKDHTVKILGMRENPAVVRRQRCRAIRFAHLRTHTNLIAVSSPTTTIARLIHGPQSIAPKIITIAKRGQKDLPTTRPVFDRKLPGTSVLFESLRPAFFTPPSFASGYAIFIPTCCN